MMSWPLRAGAVFAGGLWLVGCVTTTTQPVLESDDEEAARINTVLGSEYLGMGDLQLANTKLERALDQDPELAAAHWTYALLQARLGRPERAERHFLTALKLDPQDSRAHNNFGVFLCDIDRLEEAQRQFQRALDNPLYDQPATALTNAGVCTLRMRDVDKAEKYFVRALNTDPEFAPALYEMARLAYGRGNYVQALGYLNRYERVAQNSPGTLLLAARTATQLGHTEAAQAYAAQLRQEYPDSHQASQLSENERDGQ